MTKKIIIWFCSVLAIAIIIVFTNSCKKDKENNSNNPIPTATVTDFDGNFYHTVTIGTQVWLKENLKVTHYRNGDSIQEITDQNNWYYLNTGAYCNYQNIATNSDTYGRLYNWFAVNDSRNICPDGWHIPTVAEWETLITYLGDSALAGGEMKEAGTQHWLTPNTGATNNSGFTALPAGSRSTNGFFYQIYMLTVWWSSTELNSTNAHCYMILFNESYINRPEYYKQAGCSVRCIKD